MATVKFYQDTNEEWIFSDGKSGLEYTIQASQAGRIINGSQVALIDKSLSGPGRIHFLFEDKFVEVTEIEKNSSGDFYSDIDDFKESCADFFVNAGGGVGDMDDLLEAMGIDKSEFSSTQGIAYDSETNTFYPTDLNFTGTAVDSEATEDSTNAAMSGDLWDTKQDVIDNYVENENITPNISPELSLDIFATKKYCTATENDDGGINITYTASSSLGWSYFMLTMNEYWKQNNMYAVFFNVTVNSNNYTASDMFQTCGPRKTATGYLTRTTSYISKVATGDTDNYICVFTTGEDDDLLTGNGLFFQTVNLTDGISYDIDLNDLLVVDLGGVDDDDLLDYSTIVDFINSNGIVKDYKRPIRSKVSDTAFELDPINKIYGWGDSLMDQDWLQHITDETGRVTVVKGYYGMTSAYIRDQYFTDITDEIREYTHIFNVGRNNAYATDVIIEDLRAMTDDLGHQRFLVLMPPNGGYWSEMNTGTGASYENYTKLEERLAYEYPNNFVNMRKAAINGWHSHNIRLAASFTQPAVGSSVQITIANDLYFSNDDIEDSATDLLITENSEDAATFTNYTGKIIIGNSYTYDVYSVVSQDSDTTLTIQLEESNYFAEGETVDNPTDSEGSVQYLKVRQYLDQYMWENDTTLSTYRKDSVHLNIAYARPWYAKIVLRAIKRLGI
jgi:hypothetical protein